MKGELGLCCLTCLAAEETMPRVTLILLLLLSACATEVRSKRIADVDLADMEVVRALGQEMTETDRAAFNTFVVKHVATSARFCGRTLLRPDGREPTTIGEAIDLTRARETEIRKALLAAQAPKTPRQLLEERWKRLTSERDLMIDHQTWLTAEHGPAAKQLPEWKSLQVGLAENGRQMMKIRPLIAGNGG
jgi:hypothetical protein